MYVKMTRSCFESQSKTFFCLDTDIRRSERVIPADHCSIMQNVPLGMPTFSTYNDSSTETQEAMYFCSDEEIIIENVKVGTFRSADKHCEKIFTPRICDNQSLAHAVRDLALKAQERAAMTNINTRKITKHSPIHLSMNQVLSLMKLIF